MFSIPESFIDNNCMFRDGRTPISTLINRPQNPVKRPFIKEKFMRTYSIGHKLLLNSPDSAKFAPWYI